MGGGGPQRGIDAETVDMVRDQIADRDGGSRIGIGHARGLPRESPAIEEDDRVHGDVQLGHQSCELDFPRCCCCQKKTFTSCSECIFPGYYTAQYGTEEMVERLSSFGVRRQSFGGEDVGAIGIQILRALAVIRLAGTPSERVVCVCLVLQLQGVVF